MYAPILLVTVVLFLGASSANLLGSDRCTWGPAYWCNDLSSAKECNAVQHCMTTTWKTEPTSAVSADDCCQKCEKVVDRLRNYATLTEHDVVVLLNTACDAIPSAQYKAQCKDAVTKYVKDVMDMVIARIDPKKICTLLRLCKKSYGKNQPKPIMQKPMKMTANNGEQCDVCKLTVTEVKQYVSNVKDQKLIVDFIKTKMCSHCPVAAKCNATVDKYAETIFQFLEKDLDGDVICGFLGMCGGNRQHPLTKVLTDLAAGMRRTGSRDTETCELCKLASTEAKGYIADATYQKEVVTFVKAELCSRCPQHAKCNSTVDEFAPVIFQFLEQFLASDKLCSLLALCPKQQPAVNDNIIRASGPVITMDAPKTRNVGGVECVICEFAMRELDKILRLNRSEKAIITALDRVCSLLPKTIKAECVDFINQYGQMIIALLVRELDPAVVCTELGLCSQQQAPLGAQPLRFSPLLVRGAPIKLPAAPRAPVREVRVGPQCMLCEFVMSKLDTLLQKNSTEQEVAHALDKVCRLLPAHMGKDCDRFVNEYAPAVIKLLAAELRPALVCTIMGLCPWST